MVQLIDVYLLSCTLRARNALYRASAIEVFLLFWSTCIFLALAIYTRSPAAFRALRSLGILQLPCCKELQRIVSKNANGPGSHEEYMAHQSQVSQTFCEKQVKVGKKRPVGVGVLIWDETKVSMTASLNSLSWSLSSTQLPQYHPL